jgi:hypothetical protein
MHHAVIAVAKWRRADVRVVGISGACQSAARQCARAEGKWLYFGML